MYDEEPYEEETNFVIYEGVVLPESALLRPIRKDKYGKVPGLPEEELAEPDELERQIYLEEWGPIWQLPKPEQSPIKPSIDEEGKPDWGAFDTIDFDRYTGGFNKARFKADKLREELRGLFIMLNIVRARIPGRGKYKVLKYLEKGILDMGDISNFDMYQLTELYLRARRIQKHIDNLMKLGRAKRAEKFEAFWDLLGKLIEQG